MVWPMAGEGFQERGLAEEGFWRREGGPELGTETGRIALAGMERKRPSRVGYTRPLV